MITNFRDASMVQVLRVVVLEGKGTGEHDVAREVVYFVDPETGQVLSVNDPAPSGVFYSTG